MSTRDDSSALAFSAADDGFHFNRMSDRWWETETSWFSFACPERALGGWLYTMVRPNIGSVAGGAWVWDDSASVPWEVPYSANYSALRLPEGADLVDIRLPTGVSMRVLEPLTAYVLGYDDPGRLELDLRFDAVMPPQPLTTVGSAFGHMNHFDQLGRVSGAMVLHGELIEVDCIAMRDRSWGPRPEHRPRRTAYVTGAMSSTHGFLAVTAPSGPDDAVVYGFLLRDGTVEPLRSGQRLVERDTQSGLVSEISIEAEDAAGRPLRARGRAVSRITINRHTFIDNNSLVRWHVDDEEGWGEDQDIWPVHDWACTRRAAAPG